MDKIVVISKDGWALNSWLGLKEKGEVEIHQDLFEGKNFFDKIFLKIASSIKMSFFGGHFLQLFYLNRIVSKLKIDSKEKKRVLVYHISGGYKWCFLFKLMKKKYPNVFLGYVFTNTISKSIPHHVDYIMLNLKKSFDHIFAFDKLDQKQYRIGFNYLVYEPIINESLEVIYDAFLVAKAKDRLEKIISVYRECVKEKLQVDFYVNDIKKSDIKKVTNLNIHPNYVLSYGEVQNKIQHCKCIIDIMQGGSAGVTLNVVEAIFYNKKIISDNKALVKEPFYDPTRIYILGEREDSLNGFLNTPMKEYSLSEKSLFCGSTLFLKLK